MTQQTLMPARRTRGLDPAVAASFLRGKDSALTMQAVAFMAFGIPLSFLGPFLFTCIWCPPRWLLGGRWGTGPGPDFRRAFLFTCLFGLPALYALAAAVKGSILESATADDDGSPIRSFTRRRIAVWLVILELANIGPRMVLHAIRRVRARGRVGKVDVARAAQAVVILANAGESVSPARLQIPGEPGGVLADLLQFLMFHDVADISTDGKRVWLRSVAAEKLGVKRL